MAKRKSWLSRADLRSTDLTRYCKLKLGFCSQSGVKQESLVCLALDKDGLSRPEAVNFKEWIVKNAAHIVSIARTKQGIASVAQGWKQRLHTDATTTRKQRAPSECVVFRSATKEFVRPSLSYSGDPASDDFLSSYAWRRARMEVLKRDGRRCLCCGTSPEHGAVMHVDHIKPRRLFPQLALDLNNLQVLCAECNHGKGNWDQTDWREPQIDPEIREHLSSIMSD